MKPTHALLTAALCFGASAGAAAAPTLSTSASACWEENITRSPYREAGLNAALFDVNGAAEWRTQVSRDVALQFDASAGFESCPQYDGLDRVLAGAQFSVRRKLGLGPYASAFRAELSCTGSRYRESLRNGTRLIAGLSWTRRWDDSWQTVVSGECMRNNGRAPVYDYQNRGLSVEARYDVSERWQLTAGLRRQWGEQMTYAWQGGAGASFPYVFAIWKNTTDIPTFGPNWSAYTIDAHADTVWFSLSPALGNNRSLPLRFEQTSVVGHGESYQTRTISLSFVQRF